MENDFTLFVMCGGQKLSRIHVTIYIEFFFDNNLHSIFLKLVNLIFYLLFLPSSFLFILYVLQISTYFANNNKLVETHHLNIKIKIKNKNKNKI